MKKKIVKFSVVPLLAASLFLSFSTKGALERKSNSMAQYSTANLDLFYTVAEAPEVPAEPETFRQYPELEKSYFGFKEALGFSESGGDYSIINEFGYIGKYQFGRGTLKMIGVKDTDLFLNAPHLQEAAFYANASRNKWILRRDIERFNNKVINGIKITESGILAAAHLAGPGNVKKFLRSGGTNSFSDGFGTSIRYYFKKFAGYDTSFVKPDRMAKAVVKS